MKIKTTLISINIFMLLAYLLLVLPPVLANQFSRVQFVVNSVLMLCVFIIFNTRLLLNWQYFVFLERRNWKKLQAYLLKRAFTKRGIGYAQLTVLLNTITIQNDFEKIVELAEHIKKEKPRLYLRALAPLSAAFIILKNYEALLLYLDDEVNDRTLSVNPWADFLWAFAKLRLRELHDASRHLLFIALYCKNTMVRLLSLYILIDIIDIDAPGEECESFLVHFRNTYTSDTWSDIVEKEKESLHIFVLEDFIISAGEWCMKQHSLAPPIVSATPPDASEANPMNPRGESTEDE